MGFGSLLVLRFSLFLSAKRLSFACGLSTATRQQRRIPLLGAFYTHWQIERKAKNKKQKCKKAKSNRREKTVVSTSIDGRGSCKTPCLQVWHGHLARVSWAGRPCHEGFCKSLGNGGEGRREGELAMELTKRQKREMMMA